MKTIIAEKPSVAREIARIVGATKREEGYFEGGGYAVTWRSDISYSLPCPTATAYAASSVTTCPSSPTPSRSSPRQVKTEKGYKPDSGVVTQIKTVTRLFKESEQIIVATDAGREGELIFRYLYHYTGCATPFVRLWISSLTDKAIREGLRNLEAGGKYDDLYLAAKARSESDWLRGHQRHAGTLHRRRTRHLLRRAGADTYIGDGVRTLLGEPPLHARRPSGSSISQRTAATKEL